MKIHELPQFKCHKVVRAAKITGVEPGGLAVIVDMGRVSASIDVPEGWLAKHDPLQGDGYLVAYDDGYLSWSPAESFEAGYRQLEPVGCSSGSVGGEAAAAPAIDLKAAFLDTHRRSEQQAFDYAHSLPEGPERDLALQVYHRVRLVFSNGKSGMGGHGAAPSENTGFSWRKKPVVIEARQFNGGWSDDGAEILTWMGTSGEWDADSAELRIRTLEGLMTASKGDWIIKGVKGEFYPCKPDIFATTYEPADADPATNMVGATGGALAEIDLNAADFSDALMWLKEGKRVQRAGWNARDQWVSKFNPNPSTLAFYTFEGDRTDYQLSPCFVIKNAQGKLVAWVPSTGDLMATDWQVVS